MEHPKLPRKLRLRATIHHDLPVFIVYLVLRLIVVVSLVSAILRKEYESAFLCALVLVLFLVPLFVERNFGIQLPSVYMYYYLFVLCSLGSGQTCYLSQLNTATLYKRSKASGLENL